MDMVLAKSDLSIARRYAELVPDAELRDRGLRRASWPSTTAPWPAPGGSRARDACSPTTRPWSRSLRHRFPYLDPLNHLQVELLRRWRGGDHHDLTKRGIQLTINGLATALRNSG